MKPGRDDQMRFMGGGGLGEGGIPGGTVGIVAQAHGEGGQSGSLGDLHGPAIAVDTHRDHAGGVIVDRGVQ